MARAAAHGMLLKLITSSVMLLVLACGDPAVEAPRERADATEQWMLEHAADYLQDRSWRRAELEDSLWRPELPYAAERLSAYALADEGWDLLPAMKTDFSLVPRASERWEAIEFEEVPTTVEQWLSLGERVFWKLPMRRDTYLDWVVSRPDLWEELGLQTGEDGSLRGVVKFRGFLGDTRVGATCGMCHGDEGVAGRASRSLDLGKGRMSFAAEMGRDPPEFAHWGPGRVDVTDDDVSDPVAIPDLWGVEHHSHLNSSGVIELTSPAALAIRFETQYIVGHAYQARPDRVLTWALAMYVSSLEPPNRAALPERRPGRSAFDAACAGCHRPDQGFAGQLVDAATLTSDPQAAHSPLRGTGYYKTPSLIGISGGGPYLHDGSAPTLTALLESGHPHGHVLPESTRIDLLRYLQTL